MRIGLIFLFFAVFTLLLSCDTQNSFKAPGENYFVKYFGNQGNQQGVDFIVNSDGSIILIGNSRASAISDQQIYVAKADTKGVIIWEKIFGGKFEDEAKDIELLPDGNVLVLGNTANNDFKDEINRERDVLLLKLGQDGSKLDSVKQGLTSDPFNVIGSPTDEDASSISIITDGFIVAGSKALVPKPLTNRSGFMHMRFRNDLTWVADNSGQWNTEPVFPLNGESKTIRVLQSGTAFYAMGYANDNFRTSTPVTSDFNFIVYGLGPVAGDLGQIYIGDISSNERLASVSVVPTELGGGYLLSGTSRTLNNSNGDVYMVRLSGTIIFNQFNTSNFLLNPLTLGLGNPQVSSASGHSTLFSFLITSEKRNGNSNDILLTRREVNGNKVFEETFGGVGDDFSGPVQELADGRILMIGTMTLGGIDGQTKIALIKLNSEGRLAP